MNKDTAPSCSCTIIHEDIVNNARASMPEETKLFYLSELFKVFGDSTRIKILWALLSSEMCVCDLATLLVMSSSAISHQLRVLKQARLVKYRKSGKIVYYSLNDSHVEQIFMQGLNHINES